MTNYESYMHSVDVLCGRYFNDTEEGAIDLDELLAYAKYDHLFNSVKGYVEVKYPDVYETHFAWEDE